MAIYKSSNLQPSLAEIDVTNEKDSVFSCQVNTSGTTIKAYKINILSGDGTKEILAPTTPTELPKPLINKAILTSNKINSTTVPALTNGQDYQWNIRTYELLPRYNGTTKLNDNQPKTLICSGFLVGSTTSVLWVPNNEAILYDMWVEIKGINFMPLPDGNPDNVVLPTNANYKERHQIYWVDRELGWDKNYTKITLEEPFKYNYRNGTSIDIYQCSNAHTLTSIYVDPNDDIERGNFIELYRGGTKICDKTKIIGWGETTGEIRFQEALKITDTTNKFPQDGDTYKLYTYNALDKTYTEVTVEDNVLGGKPVVSTTIFANDKGTYFIQPNINIKTDETNPPEILFENGARLALVKKTSNTVVPNKVTDITFDKLDNTQWVVKFGENVNNIDINISPKTKYTVYTDFMDSMPNAIFYARRAPIMTIQYRGISDLTASENFEDVTITKVTGWRDIEFKTKWDSTTEVKYYQYFLYDEDGDLITSSEELYNSELEWSFRGFESGIVKTAPKTYFVAVKVVDEYDKEFMTDEAQFNVYYPVEAGLVPLDVQYDCKEQGISVIAQAPVYVGSTDRNGQTSIDSSNLNGGVLNIPTNKIANYEYVLGANKVPINITNTFNFYTQFQIPYNFIKDIPDGGETTVLEIGHKAKDGSSIDVLSLRLGSGNSYYVDTDGTIKANPNLLNLKWYKNDELQPWMIKTDNPEFFNIKEKAPVNYPIQTPSKLQYSLLNSNKVKIILSPTPSDEDQFPNLPKIPDKEDIEKIWIYQASGKDKDGKQLSYIYEISRSTKTRIVYVLPNYVYKFNPNLNEWEYYTESQFMFAENLSQLPSGINTYEGFGVDAESQLQDGNIGFGGNISDGNETWVDSSTMIDETNKTSYDTFWYELYLKIDNEKEVEVASCEIRIGTIREGG